jgi:hypothetical protein
MRTSVRLSRHYQQVKVETEGTWSPSGGPDDPSSRDEMHRRGIGSGASARTCNWSRETGAGPGKPGCENHTASRSRFQEGDLCLSVDTAYMSSPGTWGGIEDVKETGVRGSAPQPTVTSSGDEVAMTNYVTTFVVTEHSPVVLRSRLGSMEPLQLPQLPSTQSISKRRHVGFVKVTHGWWSDGLCNLRRYMQSRTLSTTS